MIAHYSGLSIILNRGVPLYDRRRSLGITRDKGQTMIACPVAENASDVDACLCDAFYVVVDSNFMAGRNDLKLVFRFGLSRGVRLIESEH